MLLPLHLLHFWYIDSLNIFIRVWRNLLFLIEEDMAIGLMWRLIFIPLFHDSSLVGRFLSFLFRIVRILSGFLTIVISTFGLFSLLVIWLVLPIFFVLNFFQVLPFSSLLYFPVLAGNIFGMALFINHLLHHPIKKIWEIHSSKEIWQATRTKPHDIGLEKLLQHNDIQKILSLLELQDWKIPTSNGIDQNYIIDQAFLNAKKRGGDYIEVSDFFIAFLKTIPDVQPELVKNRVTITDFIEAQRYVEEMKKAWRKIFIWDEDFHIGHLKGLNRGWLGAPTPALDAISTDLTKQVSLGYFEDFIGRRGVLESVIAVLSQDSDRNALLIGEAGVGKTTLVQSLAKLIIAGDAPNALVTKRIVKLEISKLMSGVNSEGDLATKIKLAFEEVQMIGDIIIYIDEIHEFGLGDMSKNFNIYSLLTPYLESNIFQFIATIEPYNSAKILEKESNLARLFHKVEVPEASIEDTLSILKIRAIEAVMIQGIATTFIALEYIAKQSKKFVHDRKLPDSALYLFNECKTRSTNKTITTDTVKKVLSKNVNIPLVELDQKHKEILLHLEDEIHKKMINQAQAVTAVSDALRRSALALKEEARPIGSFLFVGPTGVGKTELAKTLSEVYFQQQNAFVRFDMSEYQTDESVNRLLGTAENPGELTEAIKNKPYCLILLDEFEKASPHILTLFLQVLEDGRLTGGDGKMVDFTNTVIIATSNTASLTIASGLKEGKSMMQINEQVKTELFKTMKPELINRFDSVIIFKPLSQSDLEEIVKIKLKELKQRLLEQGYLVDFDKELVTELSRQGFDPVLGARPLRRLIQDKLESKLSKMILKDKLQKGALFIFEKNMLNII